MAKKSIKLCKEPDCKNQQTTLGYCRFHYLKNWKKIREKQKKKAISSLNKYVDHIMKRHPDSYIEAIKQDLRDGHRFERKAEEFYATEDFHDVMEEIGESEDVERIVENLKVEEF